MPVLCNLFGTAKRVAMGMGQEDVSALRDVGKLLAFLKEPDPQKVSVTYLISCQNLSRY